MNVHEIVKEWLTQNKYDGLYNSSGDCACKVADLMPCFSDDICFCKAGHYLPCPGPEYCDNAAYGEPCFFHIGQKDGAA